MTGIEKDLLFSGRPLGLSFFIVIKPVFALVVKGMVVSIETRSVPAISVVMTPPPAIFLWRLSSTKTVKTASKVQLLAAVPMMVTGLFIAEPDAGSVIIISGGMGVGVTSIVGVGVISTVGVGVGKREVNAEKVDAGSIFDRIIPIRTPRRIRAIPTKKDLKNPELDDEGTSVAGRGTAIGGIGLDTGSWVTGWGWEIGGCIGDGD